MRRLLFRDAGFGSGIGERGGSEILRFLLQLIVEGFEEEVTVGYGGEGEGGGGEVEDGGEGVGVGF